MEMLTELGKRIDEQSDNFNKALETMEKKLSELAIVQLLSHVRLFGLQHDKLPCSSLSPVVCSN